MNFIQDFTNQIHELSPESLLLFKNLTTLKRFPKDSIFIEDGVTTNKFYIIKSGIARGYITDEKGKEHTKVLFFPVTTFGSLAALIKNKPSETAYDCLTDCIMYEGNFPEFIELTEKHHDIATFYTKILEIVFLTVEKRINELTTLNATERYLKLKKRIPEIDNLIPQYHIASFLNVTPVQLSRIRKELYSK